MSDEQPLKTLSPIEIAEEGIAIFLSKEQSLNALFPIEVTCEGISISSIPSHVTCWDYHMI